VTTPEILVRTSVTPLARLRQHLTQTINAHFTPLTASLLHAVLLGNSSYLSSAVKEDFRVTGLYHILVISGSHIVFLAWIAHKILQPLGKSQFLKLSLILIFIWSYTVLVGANTPVWRAALMASVLLTGRCFFRAGSEANALGLAGIVMLVSQPNAGQMVDFQLSFLAVAAILLIANPLMARLSAIGSWQLRRHTPYPPCAPTALKWIAELLFWQPQQWQASLVGHRYRLDKNPMAGWLARWQLQRLLRVSIQAIIVTAIVQVVLLPITVNQFNLVTWSGILLGVVAESLMMLLMAVALPGLLWISLAGHFNFVVIATIELLAHMFAAIAVEGHNGLGLQGWRVANLANYQAIYQWYYLPIFGLSVAINCWQPYYQPRRPPNYWLKRLIVVVALLGVLVQATIILWPAKFLALVTTPSRSLTVTFLDVGQGDAAVVRLPCRKVLVIDAGGLPHQIANATQSGYVAPRLSITPSALPPSMIGEKVVSRYLWAQGIDTIDYLIITHTDWDHLQGCGDLLRNFTVKQVVLPAIATKDAKFAALITQLRQLKIPWQCWTPATAWQFDQVHLQVLWPPRLPVVTHLDNNHSLVLRLTYGAHSFLFTGDIEAVVEAQLLTPTLNLSTSVEQNTSDNDKYDNIDNKAGPNGGIGANNLLTAANNLLTATVIKVPHHGSRTSSTSAFVQTVAPRYAVISAPRQSVFGHPHSEVIANYRQIGSKIYQTGLQGAITITTDGELLQVTCFVENSPCFYH
jgi:competence protein ComEC